MVIDWRDDTENTMKKGNIYGYDKENYSFFNIENRRIIHILISKNVYGVDYWYGKVL